MENLQVTEYIAKLTAPNPYARQEAAEALGKIGDPKAALTLIEALKDDDKYVRASTAEALGEIGDPKYVPALVEALKNQQFDVRLATTGALAKIGAPAVSALVQALNDKKYPDHQATAWVLTLIGDSDGLPRKILEDSRLSAQERISVLDSLRRVRFKSKDINLQYTLNNIRALCNAVLKEGDDSAREGAEVVLNWLNGDTVWHRVFGKRKGTT